MKTLSLIFNFYCPYSYIVWNILQESNVVSNYKLNIIGLTNTQNFCVLPKSYSKLRSEYAIPNFVIDYNDLISLQKNELELLYVLVPYYVESNNYKYITAVYNAIFVDKVDFRSEGSIEKLLELNNLDAYALKQKDQLYEIYRNIKIRYQNYGLRLIPTVIIGNKILSGCIDKNLLLKFLEDII